MSKTRRHNDRDPLQDAVVNREKFSERAAFYFLVMGDDARMADEARAYLRATGQTHLIRRAARYRKAVIA